MSITRAVGGQRLGSGNKMDVQMHGYERSTHNLSRVFRSSSTVGTLVPFMTEIGLNGDKFDIDCQKQNESWNITVSNIGPEISDNTINNSELPVFGINQKLEKANSELKVLEEAKLHFHLLS